MKDRFINFIRKYPAQFWYIMMGSSVFTIGSSLVWPFLNIYLQNRLNLPLRYTTLLISVRALSGVIATFFAGSIADRFGRRLLIWASLGGGIIYYLGLKFAGAMWQFALLMAFWGMLDVCYPVGVNSMVADLVPLSDRLEAYSLLRIVYNTGYGLGPILGGILAAKSYDTIFFGAAGGYAVSLIFMLFFLKESLCREKQSEVKKESGSVLVVLKDRVYVTAVFLMGLIYISSAGVFNLLSYYAGHNFGIPENEISYVFTVNAMMCVFLQLAVVEKVKHIKPLVLMCIAGVCYALGSSSIALFANVPWYCLCMAVMTCGELMMTPTMSGLAARLAPADARGRYMSFLSLAQPFGQGIGPALLGWVNDTISPASMWRVGGLFGAIASVGYFFLHRREENTERLQ